jgi:hypothetical protein
MKHTKSSGKNPLNAGGFTGARMATAALTIATAAGRGVKLNQKRRTKTMPKIGDLKVWWIPQVPMRPFFVDVKDVAEAVKIMEVLANYDIFQFENNIKPDYCNAGGLKKWVADCDGEGNEGWEDWWDDEYCTEDPEEYLVLKKEQKL